MTTNPQARTMTAGQQRRLIGFAWPTNRPIYTYTAAEIAAGVDVYTKFLKRRTNIPAPGDRDAA